MSDLLYNHLASRLDTITTLLPSLPPPTASDSSGLFDRFEPSHKRFVALAEYLEWRPTEVTASMAQDMVGGPRGVTVLVEKLVQGCVSKTLGTDEELLNLVVWITALEAAVRSKATKGAEQQANKVVAPPVEQHAPAPPPPSTKKRLASNTNPFPFSFPFGTPSYTQADHAIPPHSPTPKSPSPAPSPPLPADKIETSPVDDGNEGFRRMSSRLAQAPSATKASKKRFRVGDGVVAWFGSEGKGWSWQPAHIVDPSNVGREGCVITNGSSQSSTSYLVEDIPAAIHLIWVQPTEVRSLENAEQLSPGGGDRFEMEFAEGLRIARDEHLLERWLEAPGVKRRRVE